MKIKAKKCKGTGKALGYGCGKETIYRKYGLCKNSCYPDWVLNSEEGQKMLNKSILKATESRRSLENAIKEKKNRDKLTDHLKKTKLVVHEMIRLRDKGKPCISCKTPYLDNFQAGHCFAAGKYNSIKFDFDNINGQCEKCNLFLNGNEANYLLNLPNRIGKERFEELVIKAGIDQKTVKRWTREELSEIRKNAKEIIKDLKNNTYI
jgi:hypothetical protein